MKILLCPNGYTAEQTALAVECLRTLQEKCGHACALSPANSNALFGDERFVRFEPEEADLIVSLGGDGSVLRAAKTALQMNKPLLGINSGRLGYLCAVSFDEVNRFNEIFPNLYQSRRSLLDAVKNGKRISAVNDIVVAKQNFGETVDLSVRVDEEATIRVRGDGIIFATPTGSTAYSLSAGGPILSSDLKAFVMTPICAHASFTHPVVLSEDRAVTVSERFKIAELFIDGVSEGMLDSPVTISRSDKELILFTRKDTLKQL